MERHDIIIQMYSDDILRIYTVNNIYSELSKDKIRTKHGNIIKWGVSNDKSYVIKNSNICVSSLLSE